MGRLILSLLGLILLGVAGMSVYFALGNPEPSQIAVDVPVAPQPGTQ